MKQNYSDLIMSYVIVYRSVHTQQNTKIEALPFLCITVDKLPIKFPILHCKSFFCGGHFQSMLTISPVVWFLAPKLYTNALIAILYTFVTQSTPTH